MTRPPRVNSPRGSVCFLLGAERAAFSPRQALPRGAQAHFPTGDPPGTAPVWSAGLCQAPWDVSLVADGCRETDAGTSGSDSSGGDGALAQQHCSRRPRASLDCDWIRGDTVSASLPSPPRAGRVTEGASDPSPSVSCGGQFDFSRGSCPASAAWVSVCVAICSFVARTTFSCFSAAEKLWFPAKVGAVWSGVRGPAHGGGDAVGDSRENRGREGRAREAELTPGGLCQQPPDLRFLNPSAR